MEVELRGRGHVAGHRHRPAHDHEAADAPQPLGIPPERESDIGERAERDDDQVFAESAGGLENQIGPIPHLKLETGNRVAWPAIRPAEPVQVAEAVLPVDVGGGDEGAAAGRRRRARRGADGRAGRPREYGTRWRWRRPRAHCRPPSRSPRRAGRAGPRPGRAPAHRQCRGRCRSGRAGTIDSFAGGP